MNVTKTIEGIKKFIQEQAPNGVVINISGGKDSTVVAKLCVDALGKDKVYGILQPNGDQKDISDSLRVCQILGIEYQTCQLSFVYHHLLNEMSKGTTLTQEALYNVAPRLRMTTAYAIAQSRGRRVVGTGNKSEAFVGYCTKWGDTACDFNPIGDLFKEEVVEIGLHLFPNDQYLIVKPPADGLTGKTDEEQLGFTYEEVRQVAKGQLEHEEIKKRHAMSKHKTTLVPIYKEKEEVVKDTYLVENLCSGDTFELELNPDQYQAILKLKDKLGYVLEDIYIGEN